MAEACVRCKHADGTRQSTAGRWFCEPCVDALLPADDDAYTVEQVEAALYASVAIHGKPQWYGTDEEFVQDVLTQLKGGGQ